MGRTLTTAALGAMLVTVAGCRLFTADGAACRGIGNCPDGQWCCSGACKEPKSCTLRCSDNSDCPGGYMCHPTDLECVPALKLDCTSSDGTCPSSVHPGDPCPSKGSFVPCTNEGSLDCTDGCRTCADDLTWSTCSTGECAVGIPTACADCSDDCTLEVLHVDAACDTATTPATCTYTGACDGGWADLDHTRANGCEAVCVVTNGGTETCDGLDNDCDGTVDDVADATVDCRARNSTAVSVQSFTCSGGACHVATCVGATGDANGVVGDGCECAWTHGGVEQCDNTDNDCDGVVDDGLGASCKCAGGVAPDSFETCGNGVDDDCNGEIDEDCPAACTPSTVTCDTDGRTLQTCNLNGYGYNPALASVCPYLCRGSACISPSNIPNDRLSACTAAAPRLAPAAGSLVTYNTGGIICSPNCGDAGVTVITATTVGSAPSLAVVCVSSLSIPSGVTVTAADLALSALAIVVDGDATVNGAINFSGRNGANDAAMGIAGGIGGPGGGAGGAGCPATGCSGLAGTGAGPGQGGVRNTGNQTGGGGGGGGFLGPGGRGGDATAPSVGGVGGVVNGNAALVPLQGGSGGGSGADGSPGNSSPPGGGGGGAIQIVARGILTVTGTLTANGGRGGDAAPTGPHGGGGGGSGGAILLEAPTLVLLGNAAIEGGAGGDSDSRAGGAGAAAGVIDGAPGQNIAATNEGGGGGGGGSGRVRLNRLAGASCTSLVVSPAAACSDGSFP